MDEPEFDKREEGGHRGEGAPQSVAEGASQGVQEILEAAETAAASILDEANKQARREVEEARQRADRLTLDRVRLMAELTDGLLERAAAIKRQSDALVDAIDSSIEELDMRFADRLPSEEAPPSTTAEERTGAGAHPAPAPAPEPSEPSIAPLGESAAAGPQEPDRPQGAPGGAGSLEKRRGRLATSLWGRRGRADQRREGEREPEPDPAFEQGGRRAREGARLLATQMAVAGSSREEIEDRLREQFGIEHPAAILDGLGDA